MFKFSKEELKSLWPLYVDSFLTTAFFISIPFQILYYQSLGFSATKIGILLAVWPLTSLLFEIPTGAIADLWGRKISVIIGWFSLGILMCIVPLSNNYWFLMGIFALCGISMTFISGAYNAWAIDTIKQNKIGIKNGEFFAKIMALTNAGLIIAGIFGAFVVGKFGLWIIWPITGASLILAGIVLMFGKEKYSKRDFKINKVYSNLKNQIKESIRYGYHHKILFILFSIVLIQTMILSINGLISWTPLLKQAGLSEQGFGYLFSANCLIAVILSALIIKINKKFDEIKILKRISIGILFWTILFIIGNGVIFFIGAYLVYFGFIDIKRPLFQGYSHNIYPTKKRATLGSVEGMIGSVASMIGLALSGILIDLCGAKTTIVLSAILEIPILIMLFKIKK